MRMCVCVLCHFGRVQLFMTPQTVAHQPPLSLGFSRQEYWSGCHALLQGIFATQGIELASLRSLAFRQVLYPRASWEAHR